MRKIFFLLLFLFISVNNIFANDLRKKAEENPLDCAFYLLSLENKKDFGNIDRLVHTFFQVGRYEDALQTIKFEDDSYTKILWLSHYSKELIENGKSDFADKFLDEAIKILRTDEHWSHDGFMTKLASSFAAMNREFEIAEILKHQEDDDERAKILLAIAETYLKIGKPEKSLEFAEQALTSGGWDEQTRIVRIYAKLNQPEKATELLEQLEQKVLVTGNEQDRNSFLNQNISLRLRLGQTDKAFELWQQHGDLQNKYKVLFFARVLIENERLERALPYLLELETDKEFLAHNGDALVEIYLKLNDVEKAHSLAKTMAKHNDSYNQQRVFMFVVDRFIAEGKPDLAVGILDFAYRKASKVSDEHPSTASIGASPGSRKVIYIQEINERLVRLSRFDKAISNVNVVADKEFQISQLLTITKKQLQMLPRKELLQRFALLETRIGKETDDYNQSRFILQLSELYAKIGLTDKSDSLFANVLKKQTEDSEMYIDDFLVTLGVIFETNKLKAGVRVKKVLKRIIKEAEEEHLR